MTLETKTTVDDLYAVPDNAKAEIVGGEIVLMSPTGGLPGRAGGAIYLSLRQYEGTIPGRAHPDNVGFLVHLPHRQSFSPDAAFHPQETIGMEFVDGAPFFAAEVRSTGEYSPAAEAEMAAKRADYFTAGTIVVWDVDLMNEPVIKSCRRSTSDQPLVFRRGDVAHAEPALPGWRMEVDELFR